jgi:hypothetical protein
MATFDRENTTTNEALGIRDRSSNAPAWIVGIVILAAIVIGVFVYESRGNSETAAPTTAAHETTQPVNPAPSPATKP